MTLLVSIAIKLAEALFGFATKRVDAQLERARIQSNVDIEKLRHDAELAGRAADVIKTGMQTRIFWFVWVIAAVPMAAWFGWGMLDTLFNGALPDVAVIPAGLKPYADAVWQNLFYTGAIAASAETVAKVLKRR